MKDIHSNPHVLSIMASVIGSWEFVHGIGLVQIAKINADLDLSVLFGNGDDIGYPIRMTFD